MQITDITPELKKREEKIRLAAYCRVSSDSEDQIHSFAAQIKHYSGYAKQNPQYTLIDIYADEGLSGTEMAKRDELNRLLKDCSQGKIDRIITKSVSRLARNTENLLSMLRMLKDFGVSVYFEEQGIDTTQMNMEMIVTFPGMVAQQESETISGNLRWGIQKRMAKGEYIISQPAYGYRLKGKDVIVNESEAETIRRIYGLYLQGYGIQQIVDIFNDEKVASPNKNENEPWKIGTVRYILNNEKYAGDAVFPKRYTTQSLPFRRKENRGEKAKYYIENYYPQIIEREVFQRVQNLIELKKRGIKRCGKVTSVFTGKLRCPDCGRVFRQNTCREKTYWQCSLNASTGKCKSRRIRDVALYETFTQMVYRLKFNRREIIEDLIKDLEILQSLTSENKNEIKRIDKEITDLSAKNFVVAKLYTNGILSATEYTKQTSEIGNEIKILRAERKKKLSADVAELCLCELNELNETICGYALTSRFDEKLFEEIVEKIVVEDKGKLIFFLKGGITATEGISEKWRCGDK